MVIAEVIQQIQFSDAPTIPGLCFRGFQGQADFSRMVAVTQGCKEVDQIERVDTQEDMRRAYAHLVNFDPYQDMLFAEINGQVIGYSRVNWRIELSGSRVYRHSGFLLPAWRRKGIGRTMLRYNEQRLRAIAAGHPGEGLRFYESSASDTEYGTQALLLSEGYMPVRHYFRMTRPDLENIPEGLLPPGLEVRPVKPEHYQAIWEANIEAFRDHWGMSPDAEPTLQEWLDDPTFDPSIWKVAWDGDQVAGMVLSFIDGRENQEYNRKRGHTENICVRRPWRRQGLAFSLLVLSLQALKERGMQEAALSVDAENLSGAVHLYERAGFRPVKRHSTYRKRMA